MCLNLYTASVYMEFTRRKVHGAVASQVSSGDPGPQSLLDSHLQGHCSGQICAIQTLKDIRQERKESFLTNYFRSVEPEGSENEPALMALLIRNSDLDKILIFYSLDLAVLFHTFMK